MTSIFTREQKRQLAVNEIRTLEHGEDEVFELIVSMVASQFEAPIVLISIVDEHRQWFSAKVGLSVSGTPRSVSFCSHALKTNEFLEVEDACKDPRFCENSLVTGEPGIRYYAGAPLITKDGLGLGTLCVIDTQPRSAMSQVQRSVLENFSKMVMKRIESLRCQFYIDEQTGLLNRSRIEKDIDQALLCNEDKWLVAADMVTPDFMNDIVKALGYRFTLDLVQEMTSRLLRILPSDCQLYKISPTRFAFFWPVKAPIEIICEAIAADFQSPIESHGIPIKLEVTLGLFRLTQCSKDTDVLRTVVSAAADARNRGLSWSVYQPAFDDAQRRAFYLLTSLTEAVRLDDQLSLVYQPRINLETLQCRSVEALIRWDHPTLGPISPAEFIPLAEKTALIRPLSLWVLQSVLKQMAQWRQQGQTLKVAMNISAEDLIGPKFIDRMFELMTDHDINPALFELEFTESAVISNGSEVCEQLNRVRQAGLEVAIDDFGSGYSNWNYLTQLPATTVKIDQSLMRNIQIDLKDQRLVQTLINLAKKLGYRVVAEGLENDETLNLVRMWGCDEGQGFHIAKPMTPGALLEWFANHEATHEAK